jgi:hypothetical protein
MPRRWVTESAGVGRPLTTAQGSLKVRSYGPPPMHAVADFLFELVVVVVWVVQVAVERLLDGDLSGAAAAMSALWRV